MTVDVRNFHDSAARSNSLCALYEHGLLFFLVLVLILVQTIRPSLLLKFYDSYVVLLSRYIYFVRTLLTFIPYFLIKANSNSLIYVLTFDVDESRYRDIANKSETFDVSQLLQRCNYKKGI